MPILAQDNRYILIEDEALRKIIVRKNNNIVAQADFAIDKPDKTALLSNMVFLEQDKDAAVFFIENLAKHIDIYEAKLLSIVDPDSQKILPENQLINKPSERLMCLTQQTAKKINMPKDIYLKEEVKLLNSHNAEDKEKMLAHKEQLCALLQQAYWAKECTPNEMEARINSATTALALTISIVGEEKYIGFVRYFDNGSLGYVSDMVVDQNFQNNHYGTYLFNLLHELAIKDIPLCLLMVAGQGPGQIAAPRVYQRFGFIRTTEYDFAQEKIGILYRWKQSKSAQQQNTHLQQNIQTLSNSLATVTNFSSNESSNQQSKEEEQATISPSVYKHG